MRISDWSSDVCSSDLQVDLPTEILLDTNPRARRRATLRVGRGGHQRPDQRAQVPHGGMVADPQRDGVVYPGEDRKSVVSGKSVSVRVDLGGRRIIKKKKRSTYG